MPLYEHVFIARQDLSNAQAEALIEHFGTVLSDNGGQVLNNEYWGVKTMSYKINKNRKGHYAYLRTDAPAPAVLEMERLMRLHEDVMRVLTIKVDSHEDGPSVQMQKRLPWWSLAMVKPGALRSSSTAPWLSSRESTAALSLWGTHTSRCSREG